MRHTRQGAANAPIGSLTLVRWRQLLATPHTRLVPVARRMEAVVSYEVDPVYGCWLSTARKDRDGYAYHGSSRAHLVAWEQAHGPVPDGMEVDHLCRRRHCQALHHLELVTRQENGLRRSWRYRAKRTHCPKGHPLQVNAIVTPEGGRVCRQCNREGVQAM